MTPHDPSGTIVLDNGEFFVQLNSLGSRGQEAGWLIRRGMNATEFPGGIACIGAFGLRGDRWLAVTLDYVRADSVENNRVSMEQQGLYQSQILAIHGLWKWKDAAREMPSPFARSTNPNADPNA